MKTHLLQNQHGFTLAEVIIVVALSTMIMYAIFTQVLSFYQYHDYTLAQTNELYEAQRGMRFLVRDLREMTFADNGQFPLVEYASTSILFFSDVDRDQSVELVRYELVGTTLTKYTYDAAGAVYSTTTPDATTVISNYVQNIIEGDPVFRYYDISGVEASGSTRVTDIRYITVDITVNVDPIRNPGEYTLRSSAALRNIIETY